MFRRIIITLLFVLLPSGAWATYPIVNWNTGAIWREKTITSGDQTVVVGLRLSRPVGSDVVVTITPSGDATQMDNPAYGTAVRGPAYTLSTTTLTIPAGAVTSNSNVTVTLKDRKDPDDKHIPDVPRYLYLTASTNNTSVRISPYRPLIIKITNGNVLLNATTGKRYWNVKDYGAVGDDYTDDTGAIQDAINAAYTACGATDQAIVYIPAGSFRVGALTRNDPAIKLPPKVSIVGAGRLLTTIKRHPKAWFMGTAANTPDALNPNKGGNPYRYTWPFARGGGTNDFYYANMFQTNVSIYWNDDNNSPLSVFKAMTVDGNSSDFYYQETFPFFITYDVAHPDDPLYTRTPGSPDNTYCDMESAHAFQFDCGTSKAGRLSCLFEDISIQNHPSGAISVNNNQNCQVYNSKFIDCMGAKSGYIIVGGYSVHRLGYVQTTGSNFDLQSGVHVEQNVSGKGFSNRYDNDFTADHCDFSGSMEMGCGAGTAENQNWFRLTNCNLGASTMGYMLLSNSGANSYLNFVATDCTITGGPNDKYYLYRMESSAFTRCTFIAKSADQVGNATGTVSAGPYIRYVGTELGANTATFTDCTFKTDGVVANAIGVPGDLYGYKVGTFVASLTIDGCHFQEGIATGVKDMTGGGHYTVNNSTFNGLTYCFYMNSRSTANRETRWDITTMEADHFVNNSNYAYVYSGANFAATQLTIVHDGVTVPSAQHKIGSLSNGLAAINQDEGTVPYPQRIISGVTSAPINGFLNDKYTKDGTDYKCTTAGWNDAGHNAVWTAQ